jgi:hypothetical protein
MRRGFNDAKAWFKLPLLCPEKSLASCEVLVFHSPENVRWER